MAGFLDAFTNMSPEQTQGLMAAAAAMLQGAGNNRVPFGFGQALGAGLQGYQQGIQGAQDRTHQQQVRALQMDEARTAAEERKRKRDLEKKIQDAALASVRDPAQTALFNGGGPTVANAEAMAAMPQGGFDEQAFIAKIRAIDPIKAMEYERQFAKASPEFDTTPQIVNDENGNPVLVQLSKTAPPRVLQGLKPREKLELRSLGGRDVALNLADLKPGQTFDRTMTPGEVASNRVALDNLGLAKQRFAYDKERDARTSTTAPKMTEDQAKATGWLVQASQAFNNLKNVAFDEKGKLKGAARPGVADAIAGLPFGGSAVGNTLRSAERQKFVQAASSLSEALLRAATGAGVTRDEAMQKVAELTPQFGDDEETVKQKFDAIPAYIEGLQVRAGPGASQARGILERTSPSNKDGWGIRRID